MPLILFKCIILGTFRCVSPYTDGAGYTKNNHSKPDGVGSAPHLPLVNCQKGKETM